VIGSAESGGVLALVGEQNVERVGVEGSDAVGEAADGARTV
jgi:hypothetical protein